MTVPYDLASLEQSLIEEGWTVHAYDYVAPNEIPGRVDKGGYAITLVSPSGDEHHGEGPTRADALRAVADAAGLIPPDGPPLR